MTRTPSSFSDEDRTLLRDAMARLVQDQYSFAARRSLLESQRGYSPQVWAAMAEIGLPGLLLSEADGGSGGGDEELAVVMEMVGYGLLLEPVLSTAVLGASLISALASDAQRKRLLPALASGNPICALAHGEPAMGFAAGPLTTSVQVVGGTAVLTGAKSFVLDAPSAALFLVTAAEADGPSRRSEAPGHLRSEGDSNSGLHWAASQARRCDLSLFAVPATAPGLVIQPWRTVDGRWAAELQLQNIPLAACERLGAPGGGAVALDAALDRARLAVGSEALGSMQSLLKMTLEHVKARKQFGQPLAKFQVIQHRLVDMHIAIEKSRAVLAAGRAALNESARERQLAVSAAKYKVGQAGRLVGEQAIQLHGAMGMTDELAVSHHFKRLQMTEAMFGNAAHHLNRYRVLAAVGD